MEGKIKSIDTEDLDGNKISRVLLRNLISRDLVYVNFGSDVAKT